MWATGLALVGGTGEYANYVNFQPSITGTTENDYQDKTCQEVPKASNTVYLYSMRWKDTWNNGEFDLEFHVSKKRKQAVNRGPLLPPALLWDKFADSKLVTQHGNRFPVRRVTNASVDEDTDYCLRVIVEGAPTGKTVPDWVQFQIITNTDRVVNWRKETSANAGRSIVNPADSANAGLMAMGVWNLRSSSLTSPDLLSYSGRGPVFTHNANIATTAAPTRKKPDAAAGGNTPTHTKWSQSCGELTPATNCADSDLYFEGTSSATAHTGGLAALAIQLHKSSSEPYTPSSIATYLKESATARGTVPNNNWGPRYAQDAMPAPADPADQRPYRVLEQ